MNNGTQYGHIAQIVGKRSLELKVIMCKLGKYCIGTILDGAIFSKESEEIWDDPDSAYSSLSSGNWTQRTI